jgi:hypothetical protein
VAKAGTVRGAEKQQTDCRKKPAPSRQMDKPWLALDQVDHGQHIF